MDDFSGGTSQDISHELNCKDCGALLQFSPGAQKLVCKYCGAQNIVPVAAEIKIEETGYNDFINSKIAEEEKQTVNTVSCNNCGATVTLKPNITADDCPFCASPLVIKGGTTSTIIKPKYLLPFKIDDNLARDMFIKWINGLWFAPNNLKKYATINEKLKGLYMPYWTYDANTSCDYEGERGTYYYTGTGNNRRRNTNWSESDGTVQNMFDDVAVIASASLPDKTTRDLEPWDLKHLLPYNEGYVSGFQTECYQVDVKKGFDVAKNVMGTTIQQTIRNDIGGDEQRINRMNVDYRDITFKHILLPIWISAYNYKSKTYHFIINGQSGKVQGQRPYSAIKIAMAVITALIIIGIIIYLNVSN